MQNRREEPKGRRRAHLIVAEVTDRITTRSAASRSAYLERLAAAGDGRPSRFDMGCANLAHGTAACDAHGKQLLTRAAVPNVAIISAYNDLLSAHQPLERYPTMLKKAILRAGGVAQFAGGVPAMCDGITQGRPGMELSLFSRDVVAMATAVALSHELFDAALLLGVCDKIVPGLVMGGLAFGHLPCILVPAGPMPSGISNLEKTKVRQEHAQGKVGTDALLESEMRSYHSAGTCTFYGTANTNQLVMEAMGLQLPGASFVSPGTVLRKALTDAAGTRVVALAGGEAGGAIGEIVSERSLVNAIVSVLATGGSTNHTMHLVAIAAAAGIELTWQDFADLSEAVPLLARIYPNGPADINEFQASGGTALVFRQLLEVGLLHEDVMTVAGPGMSRYCQVPEVRDGVLAWSDLGDVEPDGEVVSSLRSPFAREGGMKVLNGSLGRAVVKTSSVAREHRVVEAPARVFDDQADFLRSFDEGELTEDAVIVVRFQGPQANGMPELHKLTPALGVLQDRGLKVALVTDGRMSGASGKVPAAIHCTPEAATGGGLARLHEGDIIRFDIDAGTLDVVGASLGERQPAPTPAGDVLGTGRELFAAFRRGVGSADRGASIFTTAAPAA